MKIFSVLVAVVLLSGCSLFGGVVEKVADVVDDYCVKEPYSARQVYNETINAELATRGHRIDVSCNGDPK